MAKKKKKKEQTLRDWISTAATKGSNVEKTIEKHKAQSIDTRRKKELAKNKVTQSLKKAGVNTNPGAGINQASDKVRKQSTTGSYNRNINKTKPITQIRDKNNKVNTLLTFQQNNKQKQNTAINKNPIVTNTAGAGINQSGTKAIEKITSSNKNAPKVKEEKHEEQTQAQKKTLGKEAVNFVKEFNKENKEQLSKQTKSLNINKMGDGLEDVSQPGVRDLQNVKKAKAVRTEEIKYQSDKDRQKKLDLRIKGAGGITNKEASDYQKRAKAFEKKINLINKGKLKIKTREEYNQLVKEQKYLQKKQREFADRQKAFAANVKKGKSTKASGSGAGAFYDKTNVVDAVMNSDAGEKYKYLGKDAINTAYAIQAKYGNDAAREYLDDMRGSAYEAQGLKEYQQFEKDVEGKGFIGKKAAYGWQALKSGVVGAGEGFVQAAMSSGGNKNRLENTNVTTTANLINQNLNGYVDKKGNLIRYQYDKNGEMTEASKKLWEKNKNSAGAFAFEAMQSVGNQLPSIALGYVAGFGGAALGKVVGLGEMGVQAYGSQYAQDLQEGRTPEEADRHATWSGLSEVATETMLGGLPIIGNADSKLTNWVLDGVSKLSRTMANNKVVREIFKGAVGEGIEEYVQAAFLDPVISRLTLGEDTKVDLTSSEAFHNAAIGAFVGLAMSPGNAMKVVKGRESMGKTLAALTDEDTYTNSKNINVNLDRILEATNRYNGFENLSDLTSELGKSDLTGKTSGIGALESILGVDPGTMENLYSEPEMVEKFGETNTKQYLKELESYKNDNGILENAKEKFSDFRKGIEDVRKNLNGVEHYSDDLGQNLESITRNNTETDTRIATQEREKLFRQPGTADPNFQRYMQDVVEDNTTKSYRVARSSKFARFDIERLTGKDEKRLNKYNQAIEFSIKPLTVKKLLLAGMSREELSRINFITNRYDSISKTGKEFGKQKLTISKKIGDTTYELDIVADNRFGSAGIDIVDFRKTNAQSRLDEAYERQTAQTEKQPEEKAEETPNEKALREENENLRQEVEYIKKALKETTGRDIDAERAEKQIKASIKVDENGEKYVEIDKALLNKYARIVKGKRAKDRQYKQAVQFAKENFKNYRNLDQKLKINGNDILINRKGIQHYLYATFGSQGNKLQKLLLTSQLENLFKIAEFKGIADVKHNSGYKIIEEYKANIRIKGKSKYANIQIGVYPNGNRYFYDISYFGQESEEQKNSSGASAINPKRDNISSRTNLNISQTEQKSRKTSSRIKKSLAANIANKQSQFDLIQKSNPMQDEYHTGVRSVDDILTYEEAIDDFGGVDDITPDFTANDVQKALDTGRVTVYSSYPIKPGVFVTPSRMEAQSYAGQGQVYSKEVDLSDVAWIDGIEGQYAKVEKNSGFDSDNNKLSKAQIDFFKDSKVRDENGNLMVMYHGTPAADFTKFRSGSYFTANEAYANRYQNPSASSISTGKQQTNPNTYRVYLNITKPFDINDAKARDIYINEYIKGKRAIGISPYMSDAYYDSIDSIDWTEAEDLKDFLEEEGYDYDGIVLDEGADGGYGEDVQYRGKSYMTFSPKQVKNVDNKQPTENEDIRFSLAAPVEETNDNDEKDSSPEKVKFSLADPVEETKDLFGVHNASASHVIQQLKDNAWVSLSVAITKAEMGWNDFGDVSVFFDKDTIDPEADPRNTVYTRDAWTEVYPNDLISYNVNKDKLLQFQDSLGIDNYNYEEKLPWAGLRHLRSELLHLEYIFDNFAKHDKRKLLDDLKKNDIIKLAYIINNPKYDVDIPDLFEYIYDYDDDGYRELKTIQISKDILQHFKEEGLSLDDAEHNLELVKKIKEWVFKDYQKAQNYNEPDAPYLWQAYQNILELQIGRIERARSDKRRAQLIKDFLTDIKNAPNWTKPKKVPTQLAYDLTKFNIDSRIEEDPEGFNKWIEDGIQGIQGERGIRNNKDLYTPNGTRRSWEATHDKVTPEKILQIMNDLGSGSREIYDFRDLIRHSAGTFKSIDEIKANKGLMNEGRSIDFIMAKDELEGRFYELSRKIAKENWTRYDTDGLRKILNLIYKSKPNNIKWTFEKSGVDLSDSLVQEIKQFKKDLELLPTDMFEAKLRKVLRNKDIRHILFPRKLVNTALGDELIQLLDDNGIEYSIYNDKAGTIDRREKANAIEGIKFSLKAPVEEGRSLSAAHNLSIQNLLEQMKMGGLASPSIAVFDADVPHLGFGDVSVLFNKETIDPAVNPNNVVYSRDAWTPTFPQIEYKINKSEFTKLKNLLSKGNMEESFWQFRIDDNLFDFARKKGGEGLLSKLKEYYAAKAAYILDQGINDINSVEQLSKYDITKDWESYESQEEREIFHFLTYNRGELFHVNYENVSETLDQISAALKDYRNKQSSSGDNYGNTRYHHAEHLMWLVDDINSPFRDVAQKTKMAEDLVSKINAQAGDNYDPERKVVEHRAFDPHKTGDYIDSLINQKEYSKWLEKHIEPVIEKKGIRNNVRRRDARTWEDLYDDYSLENLVARMNQREHKTSGYDFNDFQVRAARKFKSVDEIRKYKEYLGDMDEDEFEALWDEYSEVYWDNLTWIADELYDLDEDYYEGLVEWSDLQRIATETNTSEQFKDALRDLGIEKFNDSIDEAIGNIMDLKYDIGVLTTRYFEAKPKRVVGLDEIAYVLVPRNPHGNKPYGVDIKPELLQLLEQNGIPYYEYKDIDDRVAKIQSLDDIKFKRDKGAIITSKDLINKSEELTDEVAKRHNINDFTNKIIQNISRSTGVPVRILSGVTRNIEGAFYKGDIYLNDKNGEQVKTVFKHELTHYLKSQNKSLYQELENSVFEYIRGDAETQKRALDIMQRYRQSMPDMEDADIREEVVADFVGNMLYDGDVSELKKLTRSNIAILDAIKEFLERIRLALANTFASDEKAALLKAEKAFLNLYNEVASENKLQPLLQSQVNVNSDINPVVQNKRKKLSIVDITNKAKEKSGSSGTTFYSPNESVSFNYKLVDANSLIASNDEDGNINPNYPAELQPRDRSRLSSWNQIRNIATNLNPALLEASSTAQNGSPVVGSDNVVESGNGRAIALQMARRQNSQAYKNYLDYLRENAEKFGFSPEDVKDGVVLVRERTSDVDRLDFVRKANESTVATMSATERARVDSEKITPELMDLFEVNDNGEIQTFENTDFIRAFLENVVPESEQGDFMTSDGMLTQNGINRIRNAIFAKAYNADENLLVRLTETTDNDAKNVTTGLLKSAPMVSQISNLIQQGELYDLDFSKDLAQGANLFMYLKSQNMTVDMLINQTSMFDDGISPEAKAMAYVFETYKNAPNRINQYIGNICATIQSLGSPNQMALFAMDRADYTKGDVIRYADEKTNRENEFDSESRQPIEARLRYDKSREAQTDSGSLGEEQAEQGINEQLLSEIIKNKPKKKKQPKKAKAISLVDEAPGEQSASSVSKKKVRTPKKAAAEEAEKPVGLQYEGKTLEQAMQTRSPQGTQTTMLDKSLARIEDPTSQEALEVLGANALYEYLSERMKDLKGMGIDDSTLYTSADKIKQGLINEGHAFDKLAEETGNRNIKNFRNGILHTKKKAQLWIGKHQTNLNGDIVGESLADILKPIDNLEEFSKYLRARLNFDRWKTDKPLDRSITQEDTLDILEDYHNEHPEYEAQAKKIYKYIDNLNQYMIDSGLVDEDTINMLKDLYPNYVPIRKPATEFDLKHAGINQNSYVIGNMIKKAKGGGSLENWETIDKTLVAITNAVTRKAEVNRLLNEVYQEWEQGKTDKVDVREIDGKGLEELGEHYQEMLSIKSGQEVAFFREGKKYIMGMDSMLVESLEAINNNIHDSFMDNLLTKGLATGMSFFKKSVTEWNPGFIVRNAFKDFGDALINAPDLKAFVKHYLPAMKEAAKGIFSNDSDLWSLYEAQGALNANYWSDEGIEYGKEGILYSCWNPLVLVEKLNLMVEQTPRLAEFMTVIENEGINQYSLSEALYRADDITVNFSRGTKFSRIANRYFIPFFNPTVQGFSKAYRNLFSQRGFRTMVTYFVRLAAIGVGTKYANDLLQEIFQRFGTDDDKKKKWKKAYEENVTDYMKNANYIIPNFFSDKGDTFIRLPKGRMQGGIGMITNDLYRKFALGEKDINLGESWLYLLEQVNPVSMSSLNGGIAAPIVQAYNNKNYYGGDIVSQSLSKLPTEMQYDENTDKLSILLGKTLNVSPKKINYVLDQYSGVFGDVALPFITQSGLVDLEKGERKDAAKMLGYNLLGRQFVNDTAYSNQISTDYYNLTDKIEKEKYREYKNGNNDMTPAKAKSWYIDAANSDITKLYGQKNAIYEDDSLTNEEKREKLRAIQKEINLRKKSVVDNIDMVDKALNKVYKKQGKVYSTDLAKILYKKIGTETANKQAINVLYYDNEDLKEQAASMKKSGISYKKQAEYFIYSKTAGYEKDTGYGKGKTTKKQKLINRLNKMNLTKAEKLLLLYSTPTGFGRMKYDLTKGEFGSTDSMRNAVVSYLNKKKKLTTKERLAILENAGYIVGKDKKGYYVSW